MPKKPAKELSTEQAMKRLFPKEAVTEAKKEAANPRSTDPRAAIKRSMNKDSK